MKIQSLMTVKKWAAAAGAATMLTACGSGSSGTGNPGAPSNTVQELSGILSLSADTTAAAASVKSVSTGMIPVDPPVTGGDGSGGSDGFAPPQDGSVEIRPDAQCFVLDTPADGTIEIVFNLPPDQLPFDQTEMESGSVELPADYAVTLDGSPRPDLDPRCGTDEVFQVTHGITPLLPPPPEGAIPIQFIGAVQKSEECLSLLGTAPGLDGADSQALIQPVGDRAADIGALEGGAVISVIGAVVPVLEPGRCGMMVRILDFKTFEGTPPVPLPAQGRGLLRQSEENTDCWQILPPVMIPFAGGASGVPTPGIDDVTAVPDGSNLIQPPPPYPGALPPVPISLGDGPVTVELSTGTSSDGSGDPSGAPGSEPGSPGLDLPPQPPPLAPIIEPVGPGATALRQAANLGKVYRVKGFPEFGRVGACKFSLPFYVTQFELLPPPPPPPDGNVDLPGIAVHLDLEGGCDALITPMGLVLPVGDVAAAYWADAAHLNKPVILTGHPVPDTVSVCPGKPFEVVSTALPPAPPDPSADGGVTTMPAPMPPNSMPPMPGIDPVGFVHAEGKITSHPEGCLTLTAPPGPDAADSEPVTYRLMYPFAHYNPGFVGGAFEYPTVMVVDGTQFDVTADAPPSDAPPCPGVPLGVIGLHRKVEIDQSEVPVDVLDTGAWDGAPPPRPFLVIHSADDYAALQTKFSFLPEAPDADFDTELLALITTPVDGEHGIEGIHAFTTVDPAALVIAFNPVPPLETGLQYSLVRVLDMGLPVVFHPEPPPVLDPPPVPLSAP